MIFSVLCVFSPLQSGLSRIACATNKPQTRDLSKPQRSLPILPSATVKAGSGKGRKRNLNSSDMKPRLLWLVQQRNQQHETTINLCIQLLTLDTKCCVLMPAISLVVIFPTGKAAAALFFLVDPPCAMRQVTLVTDRDICTNSPTSAGVTGTRQPMGVEALAAVAVVVV